MANREHNDLSSIKVIERDVRALAKLDNPLAEFRKHPLYRSADLWMSRESLNPSSNRLNGAASRFRIFGGEKIAEAADILKRRLRPPYLWHLGGAAAFPASSFFSQASASAPVTCRPVSS